MVKIRCLEDFCFGSRSVYEIMRQHHQHLIVRTSFSHITAIINSQQQSIVAFWNGAYFLALRFLWFKQLATGDDLSLTFDFIFYFHFLHSFESHFLCCCFVNKIFFAVCRNVRRVERVCSKCLQFMGWKFYRSKLKSPFLVQLKFHLFDMKIA